MFLPGLLSCLQRSQGSAVYSKCRRTSSSRVYQGHDRRPDSQECILSPIQRDVSLVCWLSHVSSRLFKDIVPECLSRNKLRRCSKRPESAGRRHYEASTTTWTRPPYQRMQHEEDIDTAEVPQQLQKKDVRPARKQVKPGQVTKNEVVQTGKEYSTSP